MRLFILLVFCISLVAQSIETPRFIAYKETVLADTSEAITVQQPSSGAKRVFLEDGFVYCSVSCEVTFELNSTAATTTTLAVVPTQEGSTNAANAFSSSNASSGTVLGKITIPEGYTVPFSYAGIKLSGNNTGSNFTVRSNSITGTIRIQMRWIEK